MLRGECGVKGRSWSDVCRLFVAMAVAVLLIWWFGRRRLTVDLRRFGVGVIVAIDKTRSRVYICIRSISIQDAHWGIS